MDKYVPINLISLKELKDIKFAQKVEQILKGWEWFWSWMWLYEFRYDNSTCRWSLFWKSALTALDNPDDDSEKSERTPEDLHHQDLHEGVRVLGISDRTTTARYSNTHAECLNPYPQNRFEKPTEIPVQKRAYPQNMISSVYYPLYSLTFPCRMIAMMTP